MQLMTTDIEVMMTLIIDNKTAMTALMTEKIMEMIMIIMILKMVMITTMITMRKITWNRQICGRLLREWKMPIKLRQ